MSRKRRRPPWPLYRWPRRGESVAHAACREWDLPCGCPTCAVTEEQRRALRAPGKGT